MALLSETVVKIADEGLVSGNYVHFVVLQETVINSVEHKRLPWLMTWLMTHNVRDIGVYTFFAVVLILVQISKAKTMLTNMAF